MSEREYDPILSPADMCQEGRISMATWHRRWRHKLPIVRLSPRRIGCRRSDWRAALEAQTEASTVRATSPQP